MSALPKEDEPASPPPGTPGKARRDDEEVPFHPPADDEIVGVERTGAHEPLTDDATGVSILLGEEETGEAQPDVLSSVSLDPPAPSQSVESDRTAAFDPPPDLFADIPDPEAAPLQPSSFHNKSTEFISVVRIAPPSAPPAEPAIHEVPDVPSMPAPQSEVSLFEPDPGDDMEVPTVSRVPEPTPAEKPASRRASQPPSEPKNKRRADKPHRPPGPMHRPVVREPEANPSRPAPDPVENELTGIYEPPVVVPELPRGKLTIVEGENRGKIYYLNRNRTMVGRGIDNDVVLMDIAVSRKHFRIDRHGEGFRMVDLASGNGTHLNGRRAQEGELYDGDRVEVGNTALEFQSIGRTRARAEGGGRADDAPITDHGRGQTPIVQTGVPVQRIPWSWVALWAAATFLAVVIVLLIVRERPSEGQDDRTRAAARAHMELAVAAINGRQWKVAEEELAVARQLGPDLNLRYDEHAARIARERDAQRRLDEARRKVGQEPAAAVQALLLGIGRDSAYYTEARTLIAELDELGRTGQPPSGTAPPTAERPAPSTAPKIEAAPAKIEPDAPKPGPAPVSVAARNAPAPGANAEAEKRAKADVMDALKLYREEKFEAAASALEKAARRSPGTKTAKDAQAKSKLVREFATQYEAAQKALRSRRAREAADALSRAGNTDRRLGGQHRDRIDQQLAEQLYMVAIQAFNRQAYDEAIQANVRVLEIAPGHALATRLQDKMKRSALTVARQAQAALDNGDKESARRLAQAALRLVNESDPAGKAARKVLDRLR